MTSRIYIIGGAQSDFAVNWQKANKRIDDILADSFEKALNATQIDLADIESAHIGNFVGELFCGQGHLGGLLISLFPKLAGIPTARHEAACASGSMALLAGMREIEAKHYNLVAVTGIEMMRNTDGYTASKHLGAAAWVGQEAKEARYPWVHLFAKIKDYYQNRFGIQDEHLATISKINHENGKRNPNAQTRNWETPDSYFGSDQKINPIIEGSLRKSDCGRVSDGSATVFLASETYTKRYAKSHGIPIESIPYIKGWGHRTAQLSLAEKLDLHHDSIYPFPHLHGSFSDALNRANLSNVSKLDAIETHDCFTISEYVALEHFGLALPGEAWKVIESGDIEFKGKLPINPSGGLIGMGHPVGATGVRMVLDAYKQIAGKAGAYQVEGAKNIGTLNIGGSFTTVASFIIGNE